MGCTIRGEPTCTPGTVPKVTVTLTNQTGADIDLVGSLDASDCKWRYPHCDFEVTGPDGQPAAWGGGRCGNKNTLRAEDFARVPPGGTFDPYRRVDDHAFFPAYQLSPHTFRAVGVYRLRFVYSTRSDDIGEWGGDGGRAVAGNGEIVGMFRRVPEVEVRGGEFEVAVVAPGP